MATVRQLLALAVLALGVYAMVDWLSATALEVVERRVVVVADLHGDYAHMVAVLRHAGVIGHNTTEWIAGEDVLVSTGDSVDRGDGTIQIYTLYQSLREQSARQGGQVVTLLGNHEVMNAVDDWRYVTQGDIDSFGGVAARQHAMSMSGWLGQEWLDYYKVAARVPLLPEDHVQPRALVLVHGGITPAWAQHGIDEINQVGYSFLLKALSEKKSNGHSVQNSTAAEMALWSPHGPFWYRGYALDEETSACTTVEDALRTLSAHHMVMGHTPHLSGFQMRCGGQILVIDTGISRAYGGKQSAMVIHAQLRQTTRLLRSPRWDATYAFWAYYVGDSPVRLAVYTDHVET